MAMNKIRLDCIIIDSGNTAMKVLLYMDLLDTLIRQALKGRDTDPAKTSVLMLAVVLEQACQTEFQPTALQRLTFHTLDSVHDCLTN